MNKSSKPIASVFKKSPMVDFHASMKICREFRQKNNEMRDRLLLDYAEQGYDLKFLRAVLPYSLYETFLEEELGVLPRLSGHIETTLEKLISFFMHEFNRGKVHLNNQLRFTYSYFQGFYNGQQGITFARVCINTIKNHFNRISRALGSIFQDKYRGQLNLPDRSTNCVVLTLSPNIIQFKDPIHTATLSSSHPSLPAKKVASNEDFMRKIEAELNSLSTFFQHSSRKSTSSAGFSTDPSLFFGGG